jgi:hypothetical protein
MKRPLSSGLSIALLGGMRVAVVAVLVGGLSGCAWGNRYTLVEPRPVSSSAAIRVRALEVELAYRNELTVRLAVSGLDPGVTLDPHQIALGAGQLPQTEGDRFGAAMSATGVGVFLLFPFQAVAYGLGLGASALDDRIRLRLEEGEQLVVLHYPTVVDGAALELRFERAFEGAEPPPPLALLVPERPHHGTAAPQQGVGTFGVFLGGGPVYSEVDAPLSHGYAATRAQGGIELYAGWRIGRVSLVGVSRLLGVGTLIGADLRITALRTELFEVTPFAGYGVAWLVHDHQVFAHSGRAGISGTFFLRHPDVFGWNQRLLGLGVYAHGSARYVLGAIQPAFELGVSIAVF